MDLHARSLYTCILDAQGEVRVHLNLPAEPEPFLRTLAPYREDVVVGVACIFSWYWLADLCQREKIPFVLGHALYVKAIHGGKTKNDRIDSRKMAGLLRAGMFPQADVYYPKAMRATRDLLRRRTFRVRQRSHRLAHIQTTNARYNPHEFGRKIARPCHQEGVAEAFPDPCLGRDSIG